MNLPTLISLSRGFFAIGLFSDSAAVRTLAIVSAALSDFLDGYFARRLNQISRLGTFVDPIMDKLFVLAAVVCFWQQLELWQLVLFFLRDISLLLFVVYMHSRSSSYHVRAFWSGKLMTTLQFIVLLLLAQNMVVPFAMWALLALFGSSSFFELVFRKNRWS